MLMFIRDLPRSNNHHPFKSVRKASQHTLDLALALALALAPPGPSPTWP